jgi:hypothetical protein
MDKAKKLLQFPDILPAIPDYLTGTTRDFFTRIVNEIRDARVDIHPADYARVSHLVILLDVFQRAEANGEEAEELKKVWESAVAVGKKEYKLSEEALRRVLGSNEKAAPMNDLGEPTREPQR